MAKNKNVDAMISAAGFISAFISNLLAEVKKLGGSSGDVHRLVNPEGKELIEQIAQLIVGEGKKAIQSFVVFIGWEFSFDEMLKAGNYDSVNPNITKENFRLDDEGKTEEDIFILHLDRTMTSVEAIAEMEKQKLRPATSSHAIYFGARYPEEQTKHPIIFLGSTWVDSHGDQNVPYLDVIDGKRRLGLEWFGRDWYAEFRFAAVRK